jgi:hypothetical protein
VVSDIIVATYIDDMIVIDDPLRRETRIWDTGWSPIAQITITPEMKEVITVSENGACQVWRPPPPSEKKVGNCGRWRLFAIKVRPQLTISPNGERLAVSLENQARVYQITYPE